MFVIIRLTLNIKNLIYLLHKNYIILLSKDNNIIYMIKYYDILFHFIFYIEHRENDDYYLVLLLDA